jgi:hypothetical protein
MPLSSNHGGLKRAPRYPLVQAILEDMELAHTSAVRVVQLLFKRSRITLLCLAPPVRGQHSLSVAEAYGPTSNRSLVIARQSVVAARPPSVLRV